MKTRVQLEIKETGEIIKSITCDYEKLEDTKAYLKRNFRHALEMEKMIIHVIEL